MPELAQPAAPIPPPALPPPLTCANCSTSLAGPYCAQCGQHVADYHRSVWRFLTDFFDNTFCWDNKFLRTLQPLVQQPGFLTQEFMVGRRARYVHPLKLFLFTSAICLALVGFINHHSPRKSAVRFDVSPSGKHGGSAKSARASASRDDDEETDDDEAKATAPAPVPSLAPTPNPTTTGKEPSPAGTQPTGSPTAAPAAETLDQKIIHVMDQASRVADGAAQMQKSAKKNFDVADAKRMVDAISQGIEQRLSWVGLALLPVFALLLRAVYWRTDSYYFSHLVFSLHYHTFLFLFWAVWACADFVLPRLPLAGLWSFLLGWSLLLPGWYLYVSLRRLYGDSRRRTAAKVFLLGSLHLLTILIGVASVGALAFFSRPK